MQHIVPEELDQKKLSQITSFKMLPPFLQQLMINKGWTKTNVPVDNHCYWESPEGSWKAEDASVREFIDTLFKRYTYGGF